MATDLNLTAIVAKAKEMHAAQRREQYKAGEEVGASWCHLPDWIRLSWFREAADELGMEL